MSDTNVVVLSGRVTRDAVLRTLSTTSVAEFGFASNRKYGETEKTTFVDVKIWGKAAESLHNYLTMGKYLVLKGRLELETWEKEGQNRSKLVLVVEDVTFVPGGKSDNVETVSQSETEKPVQNLDVNLDYDVPF